MPFDGFTDAIEARATRAIPDSRMEEFCERTDTEVIVVGDGPSGPVTAKELAECSVDVTIVKKNNYFGGGFWLGGLPISKATVRDPVQRVLDKLGAPYKESGEAEGLYVADGPHVCSALIKAARDAGARVQNMTGFADVVLRGDDRVGGIVMNWTLVHVLPRELTCVGPIAVESDLVLGATGHDAATLSKLFERGVFDVNGIEYAKGHNMSMDKIVDGEYGVPGHDSSGHDSTRISENEDSVVDATGVIHPDVVASGMAVVTAHHLSCMGPTFGAMLLSGCQAAQSCLDELGRDIPDVSISDPVPADDRPPPGGSTVGSPNTFDTRSGSLPTQSDPT